MKHYFFVFSFIILSLTYLKAKTLYSALGEESLANPLKYASIELNGEDYSKLFAAIISKLRETKGQIVDVVPAGLVYDFKLFLPFSKQNEQKNNNKDEIKINKNEGDVETQMGIEEIKEELLEEQPTITEDIQVAAMCNLENSSGLCLENK